MTRELSQRYVTLRHNHPAWLLLASRTGPLILAGLKTLLDEHPGGIELEVAVERLADAMKEHADDAPPEAGDDPALAARRELRQWIKRGLIVERDGRLLTTDAFQRALLFLDSLEIQTMTSTASRLATVQRAIEELESKLSPDQAKRARSLNDRIDALRKELDEVSEGRFEVLDGPAAEEGIREVYQLAISLQADFSRVEDSYREADRTLRHRILSEKQNRGEIVEELLGGHAALVRTAEGQVFESFHQQLVKPIELEEMKSRLRSILANATADRALDRRQRTDLHQLVSRLVRDSERVIQARARSERDVRSFLKSGLAEEQVRVGALLQDVFQAALEVDWQSQSVRRAPSPLPPIAVATPNLPLVERLLVKQTDQGGDDDLDLTLAEADPALMDEEFREAFHALDRAGLFDRTLAELRAAGRPLSIGELAAALPPTHDLETLAYWLAMAREAGVEFGDVEETIDVFNPSGGGTRFHLPRAELTYERTSGLESGHLE